MQLNLAWLNRIIQALALIALVPLIFSLARIIIDFFAGASSG
jgi:hypothetical protein